MWIPPSPLGYTTGYNISYTGQDGTTGRVSVDGGNNNNYILMRLTNGENYTISVVGTASPGIPSPPVDAGNIGLSESKAVEVVNHTYVT